MLTQRRVVVVFSIVGVLVTFLHIDLDLLASVEHDERETGNSNQIQILIEINAEVMVQIHQDFYVLWITIVATIPMATNSE